LFFAEFQDNKQTIHTWNQPEYLPEWTLTHQQPLSKITRWPWRTTSHV